MTEPGEDNKRISEEFRGDRRIRQVAQVSLHWRCHSITLVPRDENKDPRMLLRRMSRRVGVNYHLSRTHGQALQLQTHV